MTPPQLPNKSTICFTANDEIERRANKGEKRFACVHKMPYKVPNQAKKAVPFKAGLGLKKSIFNNDDQAVVKETFLVMSRMNLMLLLHFKNVVPVVVLRHNFFLGAFNFEIAQ